MKTHVTFVLVLLVAGTLSAMIAAPALMANPAGRAMESKSRDAEDACRPSPATVDFPGPPPGPPRAEATGRNARLARAVFFQPSRQVEAQLLAEFAR